MKRISALLMVLIIVLPIVAVPCFAWENTVRFQNEPILSVNAPDNCLVVTPNDNPNDPKFDKFLISGEKIVNAVKEANQMANIVHIDTDTGNTDYDITISYYKGEGETDSFASLSDSKLESRIDEYSETLDKVLSETNSYVYNFRDYKYIVIEADNTAENSKMITYVTVAANTEFTFSACIYDKNDSDLYATVRGIVQTLVDSVEYSSDIIEYETAALEKKDNLIKGLIIAAWVVSGIVIVIAIVLIVRQFIKMKKEEKETAEIK